MSDTFQMIVKTLSGLEGVLADELKAIGAEKIEQLNRAVSCWGDKTMMYKANLLCRTALHVLKPIKVFEINVQDDLYNEVTKIKWEDIFSTDQTFAIEAVVSNTVFTHSHYVALRTKDAIADHFRDKFFKRPSVNVDDPSVRINVHIYNNTCTISLDSSGGSLHKRGYRQETGEAPINEVLAAGLILLSGWNKETNFIDPMCGSGTILIEAAMIANNIPPGYYRKSFGFQKWRDYDKDMWKKIYKESLMNYKEFEFDIVGSDISPESIEIASNNIRFAKLHKDIKLNVSPIDQQVPPEGGGIAIMNPPYGERLQPDDIIKLYQTIGDTLKRSYVGYQAWMISSDLNALKFVGLKPSKKITIYNGPLECRFVKFDIYQGSKKSNN